MSKKKTRRQYEALDINTEEVMSETVSAESYDTITTDGVVESVNTNAESEENSIQESITEDTSTEEIPTDVETAEEIKEEKPVIEEPKQEDVIPDRTPVVTVKEPSNKEKTTGRWRLCIVKNASPLKWIQIKNKIKKIGINCDFIEENKSIYTNVYGRKSDAIAARKELQKKGLSPSIEEVR